MKNSDDSSPLSFLAKNLRWAWNPDVQALFESIDPARFTELKHNPVALLAALEGKVPAGAVERGEAQRRRLTAYLNDERTWGDDHANVLRTRPAAYFSAEFGIHESFAIYSGGLGVLAGDHLKSASDLGVPLVGVGMYYSEGYFRQRIDAQGWQNEDYVHAERALLPMEPALTAAGKPVYVTVETRESPIHARVWKIAVGRVTLFLIDADVEQNAPEDRAISSRLYSGDVRTRIRQELLLGVGGVRALSAVGIRPGVLHLNEGHCSFAVLELIRQRMEEEALSFAKAVDRIKRMVVFTTHTPVEAGHDRFHPHDVEKQAGVLRESLGLDQQELLALGRVRPEDHSETFCMTVLALKLSRRVNGVSSIHGHVSRRMWNDLWPERPRREVPIGHITNGVHVATWIAPQMQALLTRTFAPGWMQRQAEPSTWAAIDEIDDAALWATHQELKRALIEFVRQRASAEAERRGEPAEVVARLRTCLREDALLVGFARRFAAYKRATLIMQDKDRFAELVDDPDRPMQFVFAGKAHPRDHEGKRLLQQVYGVTRDPRFIGKVVLLESYDIEVARRLVQGVDLWLNNPRRPLEASGTSGQKVVLNGGLNCSVLDGWWAEAFDGRNGFAIGSDLIHQNADIQDRRDCENLYSALTGEVAPTYYAIDDGGMPGQWLRRMKRSIRTLAWRFNADRMVSDYVRECYLPAADVTHCEMGYR